MLKALKRWFAGSDPAVDLSAVQAWASGAGYEVRRDKETGKLTVEGEFDQQRWRFEYGAPQRSYVQGGEARMRMELALPPDLHLLLMSRGLVEQLEAAAYERYTKSVETYIDGAAPEELRWLAMYPKVALPAEPPLSRMFGMVASLPNAGRAWVNGRLAERLSDFGHGALHGAPFLIMTLRGRMYLRMQAPTLPVALLEEIVALFRVASGRAREVLIGWAEEGDGAWTSTTSTAWHNELHIELPLDKR